MTSSGHSEERPSFKPLFAMTTRKSYQRTVSYIIHLNDVLSSTTTTYNAVYYTVIPAPHFIIPETILSTMPYFLASSAVI